MTGDSRSFTSCYPVAENHTLNLSLVRNSLKPLIRVTIVQVVHATVPQGNVSADLPEADAFDSGQQKKSKNVP